MTDHEHLDDVSMEAVHALAEALQESLAEGAQAAVDAAVDPIRTELAATSSALKQSADEMNRVLEDVGEKLQRESQVSISTFFHDEALPQFTREIDQAMKAFPDLQSGITTIQGQLNHVAAVLPGLSQGLVGIDQSVKPLEPLIKSEADRIHGLVDQVVTALPGLQKDLAGLDHSLKPLSPLVKDEADRIHGHVDRVVSALPGLKKDLADLKLGLEEKVEFLRETTNRKIGTVLFIACLAVILQLWILWILYHPRGVR